MNNLKSPGLPARTGKIPRTSLRSQGWQNLKFNELGLLPAIVQDVLTGQVLMLAWMNEDSLRLTLEQGETWFWSRSRQELWHKGGTSGNVQKVRDIYYDCDGDTLLIQVEAEGPACHTGERSCFFRKLTE